MSVLYGDREDERFTDVSILRDGREAEGSTRIAVSRGDCGGGRSA